MDIQSYASVSVAADQGHLDESNLFDVPLSFDPTNSYLENSGKVSNLENDERPQPQVLERHKNGRGKSLSTAKVVETFCVAFRIIKVANSYDFDMYKVGAQCNVDQIPFILRGWELEIRVRPDGRYDKFYRHVSNNYQFRSMIEAKNYICSNLDPEIAELLDGKKSEGLQASRLEKSSEASVAVEANQATPDSLMGCMSQNEIEVANIVQFDLATEVKQKIG